VKTDRLDGDRLLAKLIRHHAGERGGWSVVRVPSVEEEDARHVHRELERLKRERLAHRVRMLSLLVTQGLKLRIKRRLGLCLDGLTLWDGRALPWELKAELERERERLALVERQIERLEAARRERLSAPRTDAEQRIVRLMRLGGDRPGERLAAGDGILRLAGLSQSARTGRPGRPGRHALQQRRERA
jgi:transposase